MPFDEEYADRRIRALEEKLEALGRVVDDLVEILMESDHPKTSVVLQKMETFERIQIP
jgi:hypothetical protein